MNDYLNNRSLSPMNYCMHCGHRLHESTRFCENCGCQVGMIAPSTSQPQNQPYNQHRIDFRILETAKQKMLEGNFSLASSYYGRARNDGIQGCVIDLRYLTKNYLVYPIEYENSTHFFLLLKELKQLAIHDGNYLQEYILALTALANIRRLFVRSLSLFYFSDIEVCQHGSTVVHQISELYIYLSNNIQSIIHEDCYELKKYLPNANIQRLHYDLEVVCLYCSNLLLSYTAVQQSTYSGKKYSALTVDYGYFASTYIQSRDTYLSCATMEPRMFLLNLEAYYDDFERVFKYKMKQLRFNSPASLYSELTHYIQKKCKKQPEEQEFLAYAKHFEKIDSSRASLIGTINKLNIWTKLNPTTKLYNKNSVCTFELNVAFTRKKVWGVCDMLSAGHGWSLDTVRWCMLLSAAFGVGLIIYPVLAILKNLNLYPNVHIKKP